jgi:hypothetical protein
MFPHRYFPLRYFLGRFFPPSTDTGVPEPPAELTSALITMVGDALAMAQPRADTLSRAGPYNDCLES